MWQTVKEILIELLLCATDCLGMKDGAVMGTKPLPSWNAGSSRRTVSRSAFTTTSYACLDWDSHSLYVSKVKMWKTLTFMTSKTIAWDRTASSKILGLIIKNKKLTYIWRGEFLNTLIKGRREYLETWKNPVDNYYLVADEGPKDSDTT